jgi:hypothetical protein
MNDALPLVLVSAWNDSGGGFVHRLFDGHAECHVWPFELQLGTSDLADGFADWFRAKYRWPCWPPDLDAVSVDVLFDRFLDDELKGRLRAPETSKFRAFDVDVALGDWRAAFAGLLERSGRTPQGVVSAYLRALFATWRNRRTSGRERLYLGHCPIIVVDADRILVECPGARIVHVVRQPAAGFADMRCRAPDVVLESYCRKWSVVNTLAFAFAQKYPQRVAIVRLDRLIAEREAEMRRLASWLGLAWDAVLLTPTWNARPLEQLWPFGGVPVVSADHEREAADSLTATERAAIADGTAGVRGLFGME